MRSTGRLRRLHADTDRGDRRHADGDGEPHAGSVLPDGGEPVADRHVRAVFRDRGAAGAGKPVQPIGVGTVAEKGTLTATVADGTEYNVGTTSSAEVDIVIAATIRISESSYTISEEGSTLTVTVVVRTGEGAPQPAATIYVGLGTFATGSATSPEDYDTKSVLFDFRPSDFTADGTVYKAENHSTSRSMTT